MKYNFQKLKLMHTAGYHLLTTDSKKRPISYHDGVKQWKHLRDTAATWEEVQEWSKQAEHYFYGYCTGVNHVEVLDVDLKVISDIDQRKTTWSEFISFVRDNIDSFDQKAAVYKTQNFGYHIVYKTTAKAGNVKLAKPQGTKEALFETRGVGGYAVAYLESANDLEYHKIQYLTEDERNILFQIARYYDYKEPDKEPENQLKGKVEPNGNRLSTWDDFNQRNTVWDVIRDDFKVIRDTSERTIIKRHGAESAHSGYIFKANQLLYLFSTGTQYPAEKPLSAFGCYAYKECNGDFAAAARELYGKGYGERYITEKPKPKPIEIQKPELQKEQTHSFPIDTLPWDVRGFMLDANATLNTSVDYMGCAFIWCCSLIIGNSFRIEIKTGWQEACSMWMALVGKPGIGKSPSIDLMTAPLKKVNGQRIKDYNRKMKEYVTYQKLTKDEKKGTYEVEEPVKDQFIVDDLTTEALADLHEKVPNGIGVLKDEMNGWIKEMNRYRQGSDLEFWLSSWSNGAVNFVRKVSRSAYVEKAFIPVLGGIQPGIISQVFTTENKENGFVDRLLLSFPDLQVEVWNNAEMEQSTLDYYHYKIEQFNKYCMANSQHFEDRSIKPVITRFSDTAKSEWESIFNEITNKQNSDDENEYMKSMLPKQKSYIPRFALIFHMLECFEDGVRPYEKVQPESIRKAKQLSDYFISMSRKIKIENMEAEAMDKIELQVNSKSDRDKVLAILEAFPEANKAKLAEKFNVSQRTIRRWANEG
jgi:hypothetical protein